jgi:hypothetical protein
MPVKRAKKFIDFGCLLLEHTLPHRQAALSFDWQKHSNSFGRYKFLWISDAILDFASFGTIA